MSERNVYKSKGRINRNVSTDKLLMVQRCQKETFINQRDELIVTFQQAKLLMVQGCHKGTVNMQIYMAGVIEK